MPPRTSACAIGPWGVARWLLPALALAVAASACSFKTQDSNVLPWLKRTESSTSIGGLGGGRKLVYSTRFLYFFWHDLDAFAITVLDAETVLVRNSQGEALLRRGEYTPTMACPTPARVQLPPQVASRSAFDCVAVVDRHPRGRESSVRFRRLHPDGSASIDVAVAAAAADQVLLQPFALFYDRKAQPYFVSIAARAAPDFRAPDPGCALLVVEDGQVRTVRPLSPLATANDCTRKATWQEATGTVLLTTQDVEREIAGGTSPMRRR